MTTIGRYGTAVAANLPRLRKARGITVRALSEKLAASGYRLLPSAITKIEQGDRSVSVNDLAAIAEGLGIADPWSLTNPPTCDRCHGAPPDGFACLRCGQGQGSRPSTPRQPGRRRRIKAEFLEEVAQVYRNAVIANDPPTATVAESFGVSHSTAARWVMTARKAGALGPASGTRGGEVQ